MAQWVTGKVTKVTWWTDNLFSIFVSADINPFIAGQFTKLALQVGDKRYARAYSYVNAPDNPELEFYLTEVEGGHLSSALAKLKPNDDVLVEAQAHGFLTLDEAPSADTLWMIASGTGIGPFLSMISSGELWQKYKNAVLVHSVRFNAELTYQQQLEDTSTLFEQFTYVPLVTREAPVKGLQGRVTKLLANGELMAHLSLDALSQDSHFMLCGNPDMVKEVTLWLQEQGFKRHRRNEPGHISVEQYW